MKVLWGDSLIFSLSNHARLVRCCCAKFRENGVQKMTKIKIFEFWFLGAKSQIWMEIGVFCMWFEIWSKIFWEKIQNFFLGIPIWIQIGIPKLRRAKSASKPNENPMKVLWGDSLIFSLSNHARLVRCCCVKFRENGVQKVTKIKIFEFWFLGAKSQIWMEIGAFWMRFEIRSKIFWEKIQNFFLGIPIWIQIGIPKLRRAKSTPRPNENPMKVLWGDSLIFSLPIHLRLTRCRCVKFRENEAQKMVNFEILRFWFLISRSAKSKFWIGTLPWGKGSRRVILGSRHESSRMVCLGLWWGRRGPSTPL